jgi:small conductance mechanosensitive channel
VVQLTIIGTTAFIGSAALRRVTDRLTRRAIERRPVTNGDVAGTRRQQRVATVNRLTNSVINTTVWSIAGVTALSVFHINVGPLLASAGVVGVALGFGAQTLVKDYLAGLFMIVEDQFSVGDEIEMATANVTAAGVVEDVALRITRLRDSDGVVWYIRNGEVQRVANRSQATS